MILADEKAAGLALIGLLEIGLFISTSRLSKLVEPIVRCVLVCAFLHFQHLLDQEVKS